MIGLTKTVAKEWGRLGIRCNAVAFGFIDTRLARAKGSGERLEVSGQSVALGIPERIRQELGTDAIPLEQAAPKKRRRVLS